MCFCIVLEFNLSCSTCACVFSGLWYREGSAVFWQLSDCDGEKKKRGGKGERQERKREWGEVGVAEKESWAAQCQTREDCRENERGWGRLEGQAYQCVCEEEGSRLAAWTTTGWRSNPKRRERLVETHTFNMYSTSCLSYTHAHIMWSNTTERLGVYGYLMKHPHSHPPPNLLTSTGPMEEEEESRARLQI